MKNNKKGFSLIELSIVLIIIGLLVAGITGGASLIKSAEFRSIMSEIRNYQTALNAYYTATGQMPAVTSGSMDFNYSCAGWAAMANEGALDAKLTSFTTSSATYSCVSSASLDKANSVQSKLKGAYYALGYNDQMAANVLFVFSGTESASALKAANNSTVARVANASMTRKDAKFLDDKMDNGVIDSGKIYSFSGGGSSASCVYEDTTTKDCAMAISFGL